MLISMRIKLCAGTQRVFENYYKLKITKYNIIACELSIEVLHG
jgi:hypothetical protein